MQCILVLRMTDNTELARKPDPKPPNPQTDLPNDPLQHYSPKRSLSPFRSADEQPLAMPLDLKMK
jgi:hypothetical protein